MNVANETKQRAFDFGGTCFNGTKFRTPDLARSGNALERLCALSDKDYLESIAVDRRSDYFPGTKMHFGRDQLLTRAATIEMMEGTFNRMLDRYGPDFRTDAPVQDTSYPPYATAHMNVGRFVGSLFYIKCEPGAGGSANQCHRVFYSNGNSATNVPDFVAQVSADYKKFERQLRDYDPGGTTFNFMLPWIEKPALIWKEDRESNFAFMWVNNWQKRATRLPDSIERDFKVEFFASASPLPETYDEGRDPNHANCVSEFEKHINKRLEEIQKEGWKVTNYLLAQKYRTVVPGEGEGSLPKNQFYAWLQVERDTAKPEERHPLKQIRVVTDTRSLPETVPNFESQSWLAEPFNRLCRDPNEPLKHWTPGVITWGYTPVDPIPHPHARLVHSVMLEDPLVPENQIDPNKTQLKNLRFHSRIVRGPYGIDDPSREGTNVFLPEVEEAIVKKAIELDRTGLVPKGVNNEGKSHAIVEAERQILGTDNELSRMQANSQVDHFLNDRHVHEIERFLEGGIVDAISETRGRLQAIVPFRMYLDQNFGPVQGFHLPFFWWEDINLPPLNPTWA